MEKSESLDDKENDSKEKSASVSGDGQQEEDFADFFDGPLTSEEKEFIKQLKEREND